MIRHLACVNCAFGDGNMAAWHRTGDQRLHGLREAGIGLLNLGNHVGRKITGIGSGISECFMGFIKALRQLQRLICSVTKHAVCIALQTGQIIELGRKFTFMLRFA